MDILKELKDLDHVDRSQRDQAKFESLILAANQEAIKCLKENNLSLGLDLLRKVEDVLFEEHEKNGNEIIYKLIGITMNNRACYYKQTGKLNVALKYLKKAIEFEKATSEDKLNVATTYLNICAILSALTQHKEAIKQAQLALSLLEAEKEASKAGNSEQKDQYKNLITTMGMAYFNYGTELEYVNDYNNSFQAFNDGLELVSKELGADCPLASSLQKAKQKVEQKKNKEMDSKAATKGDENNLRKSAKVETHRNETEKNEETSPQSPTKKGKIKKRLETSLSDMSSQIILIYASKDSSVTLPVIKQTSEPEKKGKTLPQDSKKKPTTSDKANIDSPMKSPKSVHFPNVHKSQEIKLTNFDLDTTQTKDQEQVSQVKEPNQLKQVKSGGLEMNSPKGNINTPKKVQHQPNVDNEKKSSNSQIEKLKKEIAQIEKEGRSVKKNISAHLKVLSSPKGVSSTGKGMFQTNRNFPMDASHTQEDNESNVSKNVVYWPLERENTHRKLKSNTIPDEESRQKNEAFRRVLKHKNYEQKDLTPVYIKKSLYAKDDGSFRMDASGLSKESFESPSMSKGKRIENSPTVKSGEILIVQEKEKGNSSQHDLTK